MRGLIGLAAALLFASAVPNASACAASPEPHRYLTSLQQRVLAEWQRRFAGSLNQRGNAVVSFRLGRDGSVSSIRVDAGEPELAESFAAALASAQPFPAPSQSEAVW